MKLAVVVAAAFVVGAAVGTVLSPARRAIPESHSADEHQPGDSTHVVPVIGGEEVVAVEQDVPAATEAPPDADQRATLIKAVADLPAKEAAPMIALLDDADAVAVLKGQSLTRASELLDAMPREQASRLSRLLLLARAGT